MDEGLIIQSAVGLLHTGKASLPVAPGIFEPAWYITTGFPVTLPLAGVFNMFGVSLEAARLVMLAFLLSLYTVLWYYARKAIGGVAAWIGFFLLVFFGPLYGNGRNVLGEIPGLLFLLLALVPLLQNGELTRARALWIGVWTGLAVATKPIFILFLPALFLALFFRRTELSLKKVFIYGVLGIAVPLAFWALFQFDDVSLSRIFAVYANPHDINVGAAVVTNIKRLFTEMQPLYFFGALIVWATSYGIRRYWREAVSLHEEILLFFSVLIFLTYLRTTGYYRYFFPGQVFALLYLPQSVLYLVRGYGRIFFRGVIVCLCGLLLFHAYETAFRSWVAVHYDSTRTESLTHYFTTLPVGEEIFVYQVPEAVPFAQESAVYQYVEITPSIRAGETYVPLILSGAIPRIITPSDFFRAHETDTFLRYMITENVDSYVILMRKSQKAQ